VLLELNPGSAPVPTIIMSKGMIGMVLVQNDEELRS
jgi:hypothetical protein